VLQLARSLGPRPLLRYTLTPQSHRWGRSSSRPGRIERIDVDDKKILVGLTKDPIKGSSEYDLAQFDEDCRMRLGTRYDPFT